LAGCLGAEPAKVDTSTPVGKAFARMYAFDFPGARAILDREIQAAPQEPLPYAVKAAVDLFDELYRLKILQIEFFEDDAKVVDRRKLVPDAALKVDFFRLVEASKQRANARLAARPDDRDALFTMCMSTGLLTDYAALVERRRFGSFLLARQTQAYVRKLEALKPPVYDAYLAVGTTEYVVGCIPFYLRWLVHIDNIEGSKKRGMELLRVVAEKGRYYGPFARILMAAADLRERRLDEAQRLLEGVLAEYPGNPLLINELTRIGELRRKAAAKRGRNRPQ
jgi:hypothetical protein